MFLQETQEFEVKRKESRGAMVTEVRNDEGREVQEVVSIVKYRRS